jgi:hypothetical protein
MLIEMTEKPRFKHVWKMKRFGSPSNKWQSISKKENQPIAII